MENENNRARASEAVEIDLLELLSVLLHWAWLIILAAVIVGGIAFCISKFAIPEEFQSTTKIYVLNRTEGQNDMPTYQELQASTQLTKDYAEMITSRHVLEKVISYLSLPEDYEHLEKKVEVRNPSNTRFIEIIVKDEDPERAKVICDQIAGVAADFIAEKMDQDPPNLVQGGYADGKPVSHGVLFYSAVGAAIGLFVCAALIILSHLFNDDIETPEDVESKTGLKVLAMLPIEEAEEL